MSALQLAYSTLAIGPNLTAQFSASGGTPPYAFSVVSGGAGGVIDPVTGIYTSPSVTGADVVKVTDSASAMSALTILTQNPLELFCDIIQQELGLANGRVYLWDQKIAMPKDYGLFVVVQVLNAKPFGNSIRYVGDSGSFNAVQSVNMLVQLQVDFQSRGPDARDRKEELIMALKSNYAETQMNANNFYVAPISFGFVNLSEPDGDAIPYRFSITVQMQYYVNKTKAVQFYNTFPVTSVVPNQ